MFDNKSFANCFAAAFLFCLFLLENHFVQWNYHTDLGSLVTHTRLEKNIQKMGKSQMSSSNEMLLRHSSLILVWFLVTC